MKILLLNAYFQPEQIAFSHLENDLLTAFVEEGFEIDVITPVPTRGVNRDTIRKYAKIKEEEIYDAHVRIHRFWAPQERRNPVIRAFRYFWCNLREYQIGKRYKDADVVFASSTPPTQGWIAGKVKNSIRKHGNKTIRFIYNLQDIFPDSLVNAGMTKQGSILWKIGRGIENKTYENADDIIVISKKCRENVLGKCVSDSKIALVNNWIDLDSVRYVKRSDNKLFSELDLDSNKFIVVYAGNIGEMQDTDVILKAAKTLESNKEILFIMFGSGSRFTEFRDEATKYSNVKVLPLMPANRISEVYSLGDIALITCKKGTGKAGLPSKLWSIMACEIPIVASFDLDSDLNFILRDSNAGICIEPGNANALAKSIKYFYAKKESGERNNSKARKYVKKYASKEKCVERYIEIIEATTHQ